MIDGYSICFNEWALDKSIKSDLGLLMIISSLTAEYGYCFASNEYLADLFKIDEVSISRKIKKLERKNYLTIEYEREGAKIINRKIRLTKMLTGDKQKSQSTINKNVKDNNITNINNTSDNINKKKKILKKEKIEKVFEHWNSKKIIVHEKISEPIERAVDKFLDKHSVDETITAIDRYKKVIEDKNYFFSYKWSLTDFLNRKSGAVDFLDDGSKWNDYISKTNTVNGKNKNGALSPDLQRALERLGGT